MYNENFCRAYFETFHGNVEMESAWQRYLTLVYISNKGDIQKFNRFNSLEKFNKWHDKYDQDREYQQMLTEFFRAIFRGVLQTFSYSGLLKDSFTDTEIYSMYRDHYNNLERFLNKQGDRYREFYTCYH